MGRPKKAFDKDYLEKLCHLQCTKEDVMEFFEYKDEDTLNARIKENYGEDANFSGVYKKYSLGGKISLRRNQFRLSEKNASMAIFLGKQYLGQRDIIENINNDRVIIVNDLNDLEE